MKKLLLSFFACIIYCVASAQCLPPQNLIVTNVTETTAVLGWSDNNQPAAAQWEIVVLPAGVPAPDASTAGTIATVNPFVTVGLNCGTTYQAYVRSVCSEFLTSQWSSATFFQTFCIPQSGWPIDLSQCSDNGQACFDLTVNQSNVLGQLNPSEYTVTFHHSQADANADVNPIVNANNYCIVGQMASEMVFVRLEENSSGTSQIFQFNLTVTSATPGAVLQSLVQCDENFDGTVVFDLTVAAAQINTSNALAYYANSNNAMAGIGPIANPAAFVTPSNPAAQVFIFVRETIVDECDIVYTLPITALPNCNIASQCAAANSLCGSLGIPFNNTVNLQNAETGNDYACLFTQPNPTWFYIPISTDGDLAFQISQVNESGTGLDVDYICYGPFSSPTTPCQGQLTSNNIISCSYSTAPIEGFVIQNAVQGQYYLLMVTNFSNQSGQITITKTSGSGQIDCTGMQFTAFLDENGNGTKDVGETNFPLGQFHYTKNSGTEHIVTSPNGVYGIYDIGGSNVYDVNYTVDPTYAANYTVSPSSFAGLTIAPGSGLTEYFFPVTAITNYTELGVTIIPTGSPRPGFPFTNIIKYTNHGTLTISGTVSFAHDPVLTVSNISQSGTTPIANGFAYDFANLQPFESREISVIMLVPTIPTVNIGDQLTNSANIVPMAGDIVPENNECASTQTVIGSYDPNDKMESHGGRIALADFSSNDYLYYTVRFENTGSAAAEKVRVLDVLDSGLDAESIRMIDASHDYVLDRIGNQLSWTFDNIDLPFAAANPEGAKGYVHFKIKPKPGYAIGTTIDNTASIFFDFNPAIVTNTFQSEFVENLGNPSFTNYRFVISPNPAGDFVTVSLSENTSAIATIVIYDMLGNKIVEKTSGAVSQTLDISEISSGVYLLEVTNSENQRAVKKLSVR